jgi:NB-ARC domain
MGAPPGMMLGAALSQLTTGDVAAGRDITIAGQINYFARANVGTPVPGEPAPAHFVDRASLTAPLLANLLDETPPPSGRPAVVAIYGMGGIGKTTLGRWLAWRPAVQSRFPDGRIWVTLGRQPPDPAAVLSFVLRQLTADAPANVSVDAARAALATALKDKAVLLVIDDVWPGASTQAAKALVVAATRCKFLLTTRFARLANDQNLAAVSIAVDQMTGEEAGDLVASTLNRALSADERANALVLCSKVQGHPLALAVAAERIRGGLRWPVLLKQLAREHRRLDALEEDVDDLVAPGFGSTAALRGVRASLMLSVRLLSAKGQELFTWLGVLDEDVAISAATAATVWAVDQDAASRHLAGLADAGLIRKSDDVFHMHDLLRDLAIEMICAPTVPTRADDLPGLGLSPRQGAASLVERYRQTTMGGAWHTLPDDGYIHDHLVGLLERARGATDIGQLLWKNNGDGLCGWYAAREQLGQTAGFIDDVNRIWAYADREAAVGAYPSEPVMLQVHCALLLTSINSLSRIVAGEVLAGAVRCGLMALPVGVARARQGKDAEARAATLVLLAREADPPRRKIILSQVAEMASDIAFVPHRLAVLLDVADLAEPSTQPAALASALACARISVGTADSVHALLRLARVMSPEQRPALLEEALANVRTMPGFPPLRLDFDEVSRPRFAPLTRPGLLAAVAQAMPAPRGTALLFGALTAARTTGVTMELTANCLIEVAAFLPTDHAQEVAREALAVARELESAAGRVVMTARIASFLPGHEREALVAEAVTLAASIQRLDGQNYAANDVASEFPAEHAVRLLSDTDMGFLLDRPELPRAVIRLPLSQAVATARTLRSAYARGWALAMLAAPLPAAEARDLMREALTTAQIDDHYDRSKILAALSQTLAPGPNLGPERDLTETREEVIAAMMSTIAEVRLEQDFPEQKALRMAALAIHLPDDKRLAVLEEALTLAQQTPVIPWTSRFARIADIVPYLDPARGLSVARSFFHASAHDAFWSEEDGWRMPAQGRALAAVAPRLPADEGMKIVAEIQDTSWRAIALARVAANLPADERLAALDELIAIAPDLDQEAIAALAVELSRTPSPEIVHTRWARLLHSVALLDRRTCMSRLDALLPLMKTLGGDAALEGCGRSLALVGEWFP